MQHQHEGQDQSKNSCNASYDDMVCIQACQVCALDCEKCLAAMIGKESPNDCPLCCYECLEICRQCARALVRSSRFAKEYCKLCAKICDWCAEQCDQHNMEHCQTCAACCRICAETCRKLAA